MNIRNGKLLHSTAKSRLGNSSISRLFILHTAVSLGAGLVVSLLGELLASFMGGGLGALQSRAMLETVYNVLSTAVSIALPFWQAGLLYLCLQVAREETPNNQSLLQGFRRLGPVLRLVLMRVLILLGALLVLSYLFSFVLSVLPQGMQAATEMAPLLEATELDVDAVVTIFKEHLLIPTLVAAVVFLAVILYINFRLRLSDYAVLSGDTDRAIEAIRASWKLTAGNCWSLLKLDLRFWWFYLLDGLSACVLYLSSLLPFLGVALPIGETAAFWVCYVVSLLMQFGLYAFLRPQVQVTYALVYETLAHPEPEE